MGGVGVYSVSNEKEFHVLKFIFSHLQAQRSYNCVHASTWIVVEMYIQINQYQHALNHKS